MKFLHSINTPERAIAADGVYQYDLAVNPLSVVLLCLRPLNDTAAVANFQSYLGIVAALNKITISHIGEAVYQMSGRDAAALAYFRHGIVPMQNNHVSTNNDRRCVVLPLLLGKSAYDPRSCFPKSLRGELVLELDIDIADTGYDGLRLSIETVELLDAKPKEFERKVTQTQTFPATGDNDIDLQPGNDSRGILLFGTTPFAGAAPAPTLGRVSVLMDNQQAQYAATDIEVAHMLPALWGRQPPVMDEHHHDVATTLAVGVGSGGYENYTFLDFDPTRDDMFSLPTRGVNRLSVRSNAEAAELVRAINIERVKL